MEGAGAQRHTLQDSVARRGAGMHTSKAEVPHSTLGVGILEIDPMRALLSSVRIQSCLLIL